eukprot:9126637-Pyramimonas_sp.AAC.1
MISALRRCSSASCSWRRAERDRCCISSRMSLSICPIASSRSQWVNWSPDQVGTRIWEWAARLRGDAIVTRPFVRGRLGFEGLATRSSKLYGLWLDVHGCRENP